MCNPVPFDPKTAEVGTLYCFDGNKTVESIYWTKEREALAREPKHNKEDLEKEGLKSLIDPMDLIKDILVKGGVLISKNGCFTFVGYKLISNGKGGLKKSKRRKRIFTIPIFD